MVIAFLTSFSCLLISIICLLFETGLEQRVFWVAGLLSFAIGLSDFTGPKNCLGEDDESDKKGS